MIAPSWDSAWPSVAWKDLPALEAQFDAVVQSARLRK